MAESTATILVVDDDPLTLEMMQDLLSDAGHQVRVARDGFEALDQVAESPPDLVLLDVMMPGMDGITVCRRLRQDPRTRELPVVLITALTDRRDRLAGLEAGADEFLSKPVDPAELVTRVNTIVRLNRYRRLQRERAKFEWLVQSLDVGIVLLDDAGRITYANPCARQWLALEDEADESASFVTIAARHFQWRPEQSWDDLVASDFCPCFLVRPFSSAAPELWLRVEGQRLPAPDPDDPSVWAVRMTDVTAEQIRWRQANTFFDILSHKLRTPVTLALGSLEFVLDAPEEEREARIRETSYILMHGVRDLHHQLEEALAFVEAIEEPETDPPLSSAELDTLAKRLLAEAGIEPERYRVEIPLDLPPLRLGRLRMEVVLRQLIDNAVKFHPERSPRVEIVAQPRDAEVVRLSVTDDGSGIPPEEQDRVWQPFYQVDSQGTGQVPGLGLGLPLVASYVWSVGGDVGIESKLGEGTCVWLDIPVASS